jgi:hypothetical protein
VELGVGEEVEIEFTLLYSGEPIRVSGAVRNRNGYRYGCEFIPDGQREKDDVVRLREVLQTYAGAKSSWVAGTVPQDSLKADGRGCHNQLLTERVSWLQHH